MNEELDTLVRDLTKTVPMPKSEARRRIIEWGLSCVPEEKEGQGEFRGGHWAENDGFNQCRKEVIENIRKETEL